MIIRTKQLDFLKQRKNYTKLLSLIFFDKLFDKSLKIVNNIKWKIRFNIFFPGDNHFFGRCNVDFCGSDYQDKNGSTLLTNRKSYDKRK